MDKADQIASAYIVMEAVMAHLVSKRFVERANAALLLGILWSGLAICVLGALSYDIAHWFGTW
jgi:exopolyphosphatase/pppGpp-phosphohydrolase